MLTINLSFQHHEAKPGKLDFLRTSLETLSPVVFTHFHLLRALLLSNNDINRMLDLATNPDTIVSAAAVSALAKIAAQSVSSSSLDKLDPRVSNVLKDVICTNTKRFAFTFSPFIGHEGPPLCKLGQLPSLLNPK